jgi:hypothetical protein
VTATTHHPGQDGHGHVTAPAHEHPHAEPHTHSEPATYGPSRQGAVVVDIGGDIGALIIDTPPALAGAEIEISPVGSTQRAHVAVRERHGDDGVHYAAVFPALAADTYTVWDLHAGARRTVVVSGAGVTRITW